jgi:signal peptidase I
LGSSPLENGDRLLVLKGAYDIVPPKRWETVVFYNPNDPGQAYVKRAIGLPGERVRIEHGDVFVNEKIMRKSFDQLVAMALPVYDDHAGPTRSIADRWISSPEDRWSLTGRCHRVDAGDAPIEHAYQHLDLDARDAPIKDDNPYNAAHEAEGTEIVRDLIVRCRLAHQSGPGVVGVTLRLDAYTSFELRLCPESGLAELMSTGKRIAHRLLNPWPGQSRTIQLAHWDQRVGVRLDGKPPWSDIDLDAAPLDSDAVMAPLVLTAQNLRLSADLIRIDRDVHYRSAPRTMIRRAGDDSFPLGQDEYFMLGDNSAVSNDSRSWSITAVPRRLLLGRPVFVHLPTTAWRGEVMGRTVEWSLPDLRRMRIVR